MTYELHHGLGKVAILDLGESSIYPAANIIYSFNFCQLNGTLFVISC